MDFHEKILTYLAELASGQLFLSFDDVKNEDPEYRDIFYGILCLKEEIDYQKERILVLSRSRQQILDIISDILLFINQAGEIQIINDIIYKFLGYNASTLSCIHISDLLFDYKAKLPHPCAEFAPEKFRIEYLIKQIEDGLWIERQLMLRAENGSFHPVLVNLYVIQEDDHELKILCSIQDASDSRLVQELQEKQAQLVQVSKLASLGELSSGIAHELNNPLFAVMGFNSIIERRLKKKYPDAYNHVSDLLVKVDSASQRMSDIITHIQLFARQERLSFDWASLHDIVNNSFILMQEQLRLRNIAIELQLELENTQIYCSPNRLEQVFINVIANARDAITDKNDNVQGKITIATKEVAEGLQVIISDTGIGMSQQLIQRIFDPFFTTKDPKNGTGLGLSISYGILQEHNTIIQIDSTEDVGTSFVLTFPPHDQRLDDKESS